MAAEADRSWAGHFRRTLLAGLFAVLPVAATVYLAVLVENQTRAITVALFGRYVPLLGVVLIVIATYLIGLLLGLAVGKFFVRVLDRVLHRLPLLGEVYKAWKQVSFAPGGGEGMYSKVVLVPTEAAGQRMMGFSDLETRESDAGPMVCVFLPATPNPVVGRLLFVPAAEVVALDLSVEEAFKMLISTGNYVPPLTTAGA